MTDTYNVDQLHDEIARLRAEIERLTAQGVHLADALHAGQREIERLTDELQECQGRYRSLYGENNRLTAEIERLRAAARAFETGLSEDCDGPERDALRRALLAEFILDRRGASDRGT